MKTGIFNSDFFPTPIDVIETMLASENITGRVFLEPSAGKGDIIDYLIANGAAEVIACEKNETLAKIVASKCRLLASDFLTVEAHQISHIHAIVMNPPFSADEKHITHAWNIAPPGCRIIALCNYETVNNNSYRSRRELNTIIEENGQIIDLGECFSEAERKTNVKIALVTLTKPGGSYENEFEGFFMEEDPAEQQANALMPYNLIRDLVNRYIGAIKIYDEQLNSAVNFNNLLSSFYGKNLAFQCTNDSKPVLRNTFKKELQKHAWSWVFGEMNLRKNTTQGLLADINKFVEQNQQIPFTMRNIFRMLEIVNGTTGQRMDKALLEVFERATKHYDENRHNLEGWKTNSHYLLNEKFIFPYMCQTDKWHTGNKIDPNYGGYFDVIEDMVKALCYLTGDNYESHGNLRQHIQYNYTLRYNNTIEYFRDCIHFGGAWDKQKRLAEQGVNAIYEHHKTEYGQLFTWSYFEIRAYKKGTMHFRFLDRDLWAKFNQRIAKLLGYPLPESMKPKTEPINPSTNKPINKTEKPAEILIKQISAPSPEIEKPDSRYATQQQWLDWVKIAPKSEVSFPDFKRSLTNTVNDEKYITYFFDGKQIAHYNLYNDGNYSELRRWYNNWVEGVEEYPELPELVEDMITEDTDEPELAEIFNDPNQLSMF